MASVYGSIVFTECNMSSFFPQTTENEPAFLKESASLLSFEDLAKEMVDTEDLSLTEYLLNFRGMDQFEEDINNEPSPFDFDVHVFDDNHTNYQKAFERPSKKKSAPKKTPKAKLKNKEKIEKCNTDRQTSVSPAQTESPRTPDNSSGKTPNEHPPNRSAVMAKLNREKKKQHVQDLEDTIDNLKKENSYLKRDSNKMENVVDELRMEIAYLKGVLANQSQLSALLKNIGNTAGVQFGKNSCEGKNGKLKRKLVGIKSTESGSEEKRRKTGNELKMVKAAGVCLHVRSGTVSLEFCAQCNNNSCSDEL